MLEAAVAAASGSAGTLHATVTCTSQFMQYMPANYTTAVEISVHRIVNIKGSQICFVAVMCCQWLMTPETISQYQSWPSKPLPQDTGSLILTLAHDYNAAATSDKRSHENARRSATLTAVFLVQRKQQ